MGDEYPVVPYVLIPTYNRPDTSQIGYKSKQVTCQTVTLVPHLWTTRKRENGRVQIYFFDSRLSDYSVEFSGEYDRIKK